MRGSGGLSHRSVWSIAVASALAAAASLVLTQLNAGVTHGATAAWNGWGESLTWLLLMGTAVVFGVIVGLAHPDNGVAEVFLFGGFLGCLALLGDHYAGYALVTRPGSLPGGVFTRFVSFAAFQACWVIVGVVLPAVFPTGRVVGSRWRIALWLGALGGTAATTMMFLPDAFADDGLLGDVAGVRNPLGLRGMEDMIGTVSGVGLLALFAGSFVAVISMVVRAKRSRGVERQQIKVVAYTLAVMVVVLLVVANLMNAVRVPGSEVVYNVVTTAALLALPASLGISLMRYRLYDIDRLINRTIVYVLLSAVIVAVYAGAVVVFGALTRPFTAGSDLSVAGATLAIALLFFPLRRRIQRTVDRRFYRTRYDMAQTLDSFSKRLREETDLTALAALIEQAARATMQPTLVTLWLPSQPQGRRMLR